ncbi:MAG: mycothiol synthase [Actinomycetota bacterium]|nr:mycothiol synthase [Actinomycetota bacterium]
MHAVEVKRRLGEEDIAEIAALLSAVEAADHHAALGEHQWLDLVHGGRTGSAGFVARRGGDRRLLGYAQLSRGQGNWQVEVAVHPAHRDQGLGIELLRAALAEVKLHGGGHVHFWVAQAGEADDAIAAELGLNRGRELYQMRRLLPLESGLDARADVLTLRAFRVGEDEKAWLALNNRAFAHHPEQGAWDAHTMAAREDQAWFDPAGLLLAEHDGRLIGSCWTKVDTPEDRGLGEIYVLAVDPELAGEGLGAALLAAGCRHLAGVGCDGVMLYVDASNEAALHLYKSFGFAVDHHDRAYVTDVTPLGT